MTEAEEIIKLQEREETRQANYRSLCQSTAELVFPRDSAITTVYAPGTSKTENVFDTTAIEDSKIMSDGLLSSLIPAGEYFYRLNISKDNPGGITEEYKDYLDKATDKQHRALFASNFMLQMGETLRSLVVFGTSNIYSEWTIMTGGLNFKDYDIALYQILENSKGMVDTMILKFPYTARQAYQEWGDKVGDSIKQALKDEKTVNNQFWFIHLVRPRKDKNPRLYDFMNMPFESVFVGVKDKNIIDEGGFMEFPYHVPRWSKTSGEVNGRGVGTEILPQVRVLNQQMADFIEMGNKAPRPPREVLESLEGELNLNPDATNIVQQIPSTAAIETGSPGYFVVTDKIIEMQRDVVHAAFKRDVFVQLADLKGDRRTTVEIRQRIIEGLRRLGQPVGRVQSELLEPLIHRTLNLLIRNGEIPRPPNGLEVYEIEYLGLMANALSSGQARGFQQWAAIGTQLSEFYPGITDNVDSDEGFRDLGRSLGVKAEHIKSEEDREAIRKARAAELQKQQLIEAAQAAAQGYSQTTGAPEEGSPASALMDTANA